MNKKFYITTAIAYPNAKPHLGHALEIVQADVVARFHRLAGKDVVFQTGTDEHGLKNWQTAQKLGKDVLAFLDENVSAYKDLYKELGISYNRFVRTTDKEHHYPRAQQLWQALVAAGDIYKQQYKGTYCTGCEAFKQERELEDGKCPLHPTREMEIVEEENYFFRLSKYKDELLTLIKDDVYKVTPESRKNEILSFLEEAKDISFSRPKKSLPWGIPVPGDEEHVMYVWCDALSNYITGAGYGTDSFDEEWPADIHMIGKDILRFHAAFWPAMLLSAKLALPKQLFVHGFILTKGVKMSKSTGNVVEPMQQIKLYGAEQFRYYVLHAMPMEADGDYSEEVFVDRINTELMGNLSNFCYRTLSFIKKNYDGKLTTAAAHDVTAKTAALSKQIVASYESFEFRKALQEIMHLSQSGNVYLQEAAPWKNKEGGQEVLTLCASVVKDLSILLSPVMPAFCEQLQAQLNVHNLSLQDVGKPLENHTIGEPEIILRKVESEAPKEPKTKAIDPSILRLEVATIVSAEQHPDAEKLFIEKLDSGKQIVSGLVGHYTAAELTGKKIILVANLKPAKLRGILSEGMLLAAEQDGVVEVLSPAGDSGTPVTIEGFEQNSNEISIDEFSKLKLKVKGHETLCNGARLLSDGKPVLAKQVVDGKVK